MSQSIYDVAEYNEKQKMKADIIYDAFMNKDTTNMDKMCKEILELVNSRYPNLSDGFKKYTDMTLTDDARISKQALLLFGLWLTPDYAKTLVTPTPKLNPNKFQVFYSTILPKMCNQLLTGHFTSLQEFVEFAIPTYIQM
jgi:hypothetical protein